MSSISSQFGMPNDVPKNNPSCDPWDFQRDEKI